MHEDIFANRGRARIREGEERSPEETKFTNGHTQTYTPRFFMIRKEQTTDLDPRSVPLKNTYNSTFIVLVIVIAAVLAAILVFWPSAGI
ncbi:MAG: hypothetical protein HY735_36055 [Verrucomicrobia bacterium]|nr:hypothetical protein [Verrucomicrobiota bacterium]